MLPAELFVVSFLSDQNSDNQDDLCNKLFYMKII